MEKLLSLYLRTGGLGLIPCSSCMTKIIDREFQQESHMTAMKVKALILLIICTLTE